MKPDKKEERSITNMNGITDSKVVCDITNMNCLAEEESSSETDIANMNGVTHDDAVTCALDDMNCRGGK